MRFTVDFETTTDDKDCRVWAVGICDIDYPDLFTYGNNISYLFNHFKLNPNSTYYFHNLKFDGEFIMQYLYRNGWKWREEKRFLKDNEFTTLISDKGQHYSYTLKFDNKNTITINDSLKLLPFSVHDVSIAFGLKETKLKIDYKAYRAPDHILTPQEVDYLKNDVVIMAKALQYLFSQGLTKLTQGSNALYDYKNIFGKKEFKKVYPILDYFYDKDIRQAYRGGFTYLNPMYKGLVDTEGLILDVNSLYPYVMYVKPLPYGEPIFFDGKYKHDDLYPLYIQHISVMFELKPSHIPTIQLKNNLSFIPTEYLTSSAGEMVELYLTNVDLELFKKQYDIIDIDYLNGWKFKSHIGFFEEYINKWVSIKIQATKDKNKPLRTLAKLMLNALYGKFGLNPNVCSKIPYLRDGVIKYDNGADEIRDSIYVPLAIFVTSHARFLTITSAQKVYKRFVYADTDSLHLIGTDIPDGLKIHDTDLGAWKIEGKFRRAKYLRQKCYCEEIYIDKKEYEDVLNDNDNEYKNLYNRYDDIYTMYNITVSGMPNKCYPFFDFDSFDFGKSYKGKLQFNHVDGGIILKDIDFTIKY